MKNSVLILAAGSGTRITKQNQKKQFLTLGDGRSILEHSVSIFTDLKEIHHICIVIPKDNLKEIEAINFNSDKIHIITGGATRQESTLKGLQFLNNMQPDKVLIHDACRPFASQLLIKNILKQLDSNEGVVPAIPVQDTLKQAEKNNVCWTIDRTNLWLTQTPQGFQFDKILNYHICHAGKNFSDDSGVLEYSGEKVKIIPGSFNNFKITSDDDLSFAREITKQHSSTIRIGHGYDSHRFEEKNSKNKNNTIKIGGISIPYEKSIIAHSDGDVVLHALTDSILGSMGLDDIGEHFPNNDNAYKDADSTIFLQDAISKLKIMNGKIINIDINIIAEEPKISPYKHMIKDKLASILETDVGSIAIKAKSNEKMDDIGNKKGLSASATVLITIDKK